MCFLLIAFHPIQPQDTKGKWYTYLSEEGKVRINFPAEYAEEVKANNPNAPRKISARYNNVDYILSYTIHETPIVMHSEMAKVSVESFVEALGGELVMNKAYTYKGNTGQSALIMLKNGQLTVNYRVILVGQIQYQVIVVSPTASQDIKTLNKFLKSFKLIE